METQRSSQWGRAEIGLAVPNPLSLGPCGPIVGKMEAFGPAEMSTRTRELRSASTPNSVEKQPKGLAQPGRETGAERGRRRGAGPIAPAVERNRRHLLTEHDADPARS